MESHRVSLAIVIVCSALLTVLSAQTSLEVEVEALKAFKKSITSDPNGTLTDWTSEASHHCNWSGIACDPSTNQVISISLVEKQLAGVISPFLGNISGLQVLDLTSNSFTGHIPAELGLCSQLSQLALYQNSLSGSIPPELGNLGNLQSLDLGDNFLSGSIPESICNCRNLSLVGAEFNNLTGKIPSNIGNLVNLQLLLANGNNFTGSLPASMGKLAAFKAVDLSKNQLSGALPRELGNLSNLEQLVVFENSFVGEIPSELSWCKKLVNLEIYSNHFTGSIPPELGSLVHLETLRLYKNRLNSTIPLSIFQLKSLTHLELSNNELSGTIPSELGSLRSLQMLTLHSNKFTGKIPSSLTSLTNLTYLSMSLNFLTGELPSNIGSLYNLKNLSMNGNLLEGSIPSSITNCTNLQVISLAINRITGKIPQGLGQLQNLSFFSVGSNKLFGEIPDDLFNCTTLSTLDLGLNNFSGYLKPRIGKLSNLRRLKAFANSFVGRIPPEIGQLNQLIVLDLGENRFSGPVPPQLSNLSHLQGLSLDNNALEGAIPEKLFELKELTKLELQQNKLIGPIPDSVSKLELLSYLNLQGNMLNGSIPKSMAHLNRLTTVDLSHNHLSGPIPGSVVSGMKSMQIYLNFSYNFLDGSIPDELGMLEMVQAIDISNNNFSGMIPRALEGCRNLYSLDLSGNKLSGPIQAEVFAKMDTLTSLNLSRNNLDGELPEELTNLKHLSSLDLSQNSLRGVIPEGFSNFTTTLKHLNLSFNQLEGPLPDTGLFRSMNASSLVGNPDLCGDILLKTCKKSSRISKTTMYVLVSLGIASVLLILVIIFLFLNRFNKLRKQEKVENPELECATALTLKRFDPKDLENATGRFSKENILGASSLSTVYKGGLEDGQIVAIKSLNLQQFSVESDKCFNREIKTLSQLRHRNLVKVLGYAWESGKLKALVLEYMENGNLENIIHEDGMNQWRLTFSQRINILVSIASGLDYLHSGYDFPIVHCDLKPSNILLDDDWEAHVSDFGTARMLGVHLQDGSSLSTASAFQGTIGYLAPEFAYMRKITTKVDVFSFGVIVMELLTRQRPTGIMEENGQPMSLHQLVEKALANGSHSLLEVLDPMLTSNISKVQEASAEELLKLALICTNQIPEERPIMNEVVCKVLQWTLSGNNGLNKEAKHREHGQPTILELLHLKLSKCFWVISKAQWVEAASWVKWVFNFTKWASSNSVSLNCAHQDDLGGPDGQDALRVDQARVAQVVEPALAEDLGSGLEPHCLAELDTVAGQELGEDAPESSEHGPPGVDHFELTVLGKGLWVGREPSSVPTVVTGELTSEVTRGLAREWAQVLDSVWAVPWASGGNSLADSFPHGDPSGSENLGGGKLHSLAGECWGREGHCGSSHC
ncbi:hypothetical protein ACLB2K_024066 [Fragaria x ananassa]